MALPLLLLSTTAIIVPVPVPVLGIPTSGHQQRISVLLQRYGLLRFGGGSPVDLWDGIPPPAGISSRSRVTAALGRPQKFPRNVPRPIPGIRR